MCIRDSSSGSTDTVRPAKGPADAVAYDSDAEPASHADKNSPQPCGETEKTHMPFHAAVLDTSMENVSIVQEWNQLVRSCDVLGSIGRSIEGIRASAVSDDKKEEALAKQEELGKATLALSRLAHDDVRAALREWENHDEGITDDSQRTMCLTYIGYTEYIEKIAGYLFFTL